MILCMFLPPMPIIRLWYASGTWKDISAGSSSCRSVRPVRIEASEPERSIRKLWSLNVSNFILTDADCMILLILPFFLPEMNSRCSLASSTWKRISWWNACYLCSVSGWEKFWETNKTYFHEIQVQDHVDGRSDFILETMHLETHALKHNLCARRERDLLQEGRHLRTIEGRRREEHVELDWKKPERRDIVLAGLSV